LGDLTAPPLAALAGLEGAGFDAGDLGLDVTDDMFLGCE
jgi:hypothetical protein